MSEEVVKTFDRRRGIMPLPASPSRNARMRPYEAYVSRLQRIVEESLSTPANLDGQARKEICQALDGEPAKELRRLIQLDIQRASGAFFSGQKLSDHLSSLLSFEKAGRNPVIIDPACGTGDLLLACSKHLPLSEDLFATLSQWGKSLIGYDLHSEFVRATKIRLALAAISRGVPCSHTSWESIDKSFPSIKVRDALESSPEIGRATHIVLNPPYVQRATPPNCVWAKGLVSSAAVFLDTCISRAMPGAQVSAILPDVLRTGSRYERWRQHIQKLATVRNVRTIGKFDRWADVDVFLICLIVDNNSCGRQIWWRAKNGSHSGKAKDYFKVHIGSVVPHRDAKKGSLRRYIYSRLLPPWQIVRRVKTRKYAGKVFLPPFVAVRRTSSPGDRYRAVATIVTGKKPVAAENHLLVLLPHDKSLRRCHELLRVLKSADTNKWLNSRIRCRHLTVPALRELPWWTRTR